MILVKISSNKDINLLIPHTNLSIYIVKINQSISEKGLIIDNSYENRKGHPRILPKTFTQTTVPALIYHRRTIPFRFPPVSPVSGTLRNSETLFLGILSDAWDGSLARTVYLIPGYCENEAKERFVDSQWTEGLLFQDLRGDMWP